MHRAWALLLLAVLPGLALGQSLGDAARKEAERRRKKKETGVKAPSYTDEGRPAPETAPSGTPGPAPSPRPDRQPSAEAGDASNRSKEDYWRGRWADARARRDAAKAKYDKVNELWLAPGES